MTSQGKLLDFLWEVAPLAVAVGAGIVTYYMTKDNDENYINSDGARQPEYTDYQYNQPAYQEVQDLGSSQISSFPMKDYPGNEQLGAIVELLEKNAANADPPRWAEQLFQVTNALSDEVKTIKEIVLTNSPQRTANAANSTKRVRTQEEMVLDIKSKFNECTNSTVEKALLVNVSYKILQSAVQSLHLYTNNIVENINVPRYRKISTTNNTYKSNVQPLEGHEKLLEVLGFTLNGSTYEWIPPYTSADPGNVMNESSWIEYFRHVLTTFSLIKSADNYTSVTEALAEHFVDTPSASSIPVGSNGEDGDMASISKGDSEDVVSSS